MKNPTYGFEITSDLKGLDALYKRLQDLNQKEIQWGYFEESRYTTDDSRGKRNLPVAAIAWWHENGLGSILLGPPVQANYPARPFFTQSLKKAEWMIRQSAPAVFKAAIEGKQEKNFVKMANWLKESVQDSIDEQDFVPLSERTIAQKTKEGWANPSKALEESGTLRNSVQAKIVNNNAYGSRKKEVDV